MFCRANYEIIHHLLKETDIGFIYLFICLFIVIYLFILTTNWFTYSYYKLNEKFNKVEKRGGLGVL